MKTTSVLGKFYELHLADPVISKHAVISGMGLASFTVHNSIIIGYIKEHFKNKFEVQAEFSYFRNHFLHYSPAVSEDKSLGSGNLYVRVGGDIIHFVVIPIDETTVVVKPAQEIDCSVDLRFSVDVNETLRDYPCKYKAMADHICAVIEATLKERHAKE